MAINKKTGLFPVDIKAEGKLSLYDVTQPSISFNHADLLSTKDSSPTLNQKNLINAINHINFTDGSIFVHLKDIEYGDDIYVSSYPDPCIDETITCYWPENFSFAEGNYEFQNLIILDGLSVILTPALPRNIADDHFTVLIPEKGHILGTRASRRYSCDNIGVMLSQGVFSAKGTLLDFSSQAFRIRGTPSQDSSFHWFNSETHTILHLTENKKVIFSGPCRCVRQTDNPVEREIVLSPDIENIKRSKETGDKEPSSRLNPSPGIVFTHPLIRKKIHLDIHEMSLKGFSVTETASESVLMPGLIIPEMTINCFGALKMKCTAQVACRREEKDGSVVSEFLILDMDFATYGKFCNILLNVKDSHIHISEEVNLEDLWKFLFDANFIYPKKYKSIQSYREDFKETYSKLYHNNHEIAQHLTYQKYGQIYGHVSMVRSYQRAWMIHHLAARPIKKKHTGLPILRQLLNYFDGIHRLPSVKMDYMIFYFRPENKFMNMFFGGFARELDNPRACSLDLFSYGTLQKPDMPGRLSEDYVLKEFSPHDFHQLDRFYRNKSGGLLLDMLGLRQSDLKEEPMEHVYKRHGFSRSVQVYSLINAKDSRLKAVIIVNQSDLGLNLSELLNCIKVIVTDTVRLPWEVLQNAVTSLATSYKLDNVPIMIYPHTYAEHHGVASEKRYALWTLNTHYGKEYLDYMQDRTKLKLRYLIKFLIRKYFNNGR